MSEVVAPTHSALLQKAPPPPPGMMSPAAALGKLLSLPALLFCPHGWTT